VTQIDPGQAVYSIREHAFRPKEGARPKPQPIQIDMESIEEKQVETQELNGTAQATDRPVDPGEVELQTKN
jgi:hypothetical protein